MIPKVKKAITTFLAEYRQVKWPTPRVTVNLALFVIIASAIITLMILGLDSFFYELRSRFFIN